MRSIPTLSLRARLGHAAALVSTLAVGCSATVASDDTASSEQATTLGRLDAIDRKLTDLKAKADRPDYI